MTKQIERILWSFLEDLRGKSNISRKWESVFNLMSLRFFEENRKQYNVPDNARWSQLNPISDEEVSTVLKEAYASFEAANVSAENLFIEENVNSLNLEEFYMIRGFANQLELKIPKAGETFETIWETMSSSVPELMSYSTPRMLGRLMALLLDVDKGAFYDGTMGSGQFLVEMGKEAQQFNQPFKLYGQEINSSILSIARMNMLMHDMPHKVKSGDTLTMPRFIQEGKLQTFDAVVMAFPFSMSWRETEEIKIKYDKYDRFPYGVPSKTKADWLFVQHGIASLNSTGRAAFLTTQGMLSTGATERKIRQKIIDDDLIETVILLPSNVLSDTSIPTTIIILNKNKSDERKGTIQLINTEEIFSDVKSKKRQSISITDKEIEEIITVYKLFSNIKNKSIIVNNDGIEDANLSFSAYANCVEVKTNFGLTEVNKKAFEKETLNRKTINEIGEIYRGIPSSNKEITDGEKCYVVQLSDIQDNQVILNNLSKMEVDSSRIRNSLVKEGDVLLSSRGNVIKVAVMPKTNKKVVLSQNILGIRPDREIINSYYLQTYLTSPVGMAYLTSTQKASAVLMLSQKDVRTISVPVINKEDQLMIGNKMKRAHAEYAEKIEYAKRQYQQEHQEAYNMANLNQYFQIIEED
ncbi:Type I restriction-modification system methyltransferase subunit [Aerococcus viridans]|nr:Type I restriction-modification system methyltransferase subunit [Aerococcus viridans]